MTKMFLEDNEIMIYFAMVKFVSQRVYQNFHLTHSDVYDTFSTVHLS